MFCILANTISATTDLSFTLDGVPSGRFSHVSDGTSSYVYGAAVFSRTGLENEPHQVVVATDNTAGSLLLFDFAIYT